MTSMSRVVRTVVAVVLVMGLAAPAMAQNKNKNKEKKDQSEQAQKAIQKQKDIAKGLGEKAANDPAVLQKQLDDAKAALQAEKDRHAAAIEKMTADLKTATAAGQSAKAKTTEKAIEKEKEQHQRKLADLQKQVDAAQAKVAPK